MEPPAAYPPTGNLHGCLSPGRAPTTPHRRAPLFACGGIVLERHESAAGTARHYMTGALAALRVTAGLAEPAESITSELVTNAVRHGNPDAGPVRLLLDLRHSVLTITVADASPYRPFPPTGSPSCDESNLETWQERGRGLVLVAALSARWGHRPVAGAPEYGTAVWAELPPAAP
jgi:serine/threonine-protein kinase RsbW